MSINDKLFDFSKPRRAEPLINNEIKYKSIFENMNEGILFFEPINNGEEFIVSDINPAGENIYRLKKELIVGKNVFKVFPNIRDYGLFEAIHRVNKTGVPEYHPDIKYENEKMVGWWKHFLYKLPTGEVVSIYSDETQQKMIQLELVDFESRYRALFNNANDAILVHDLDGRILEVNRIACELLDFPFEQIQKMQMTDIVSPEMGLTSEQMKKLNQQGSLVYETAYRRSDGETIPVEVSSRIVEYDMKPVIMTLARDIRDRKKAETEKLELMNQLRQSQKMEAIGTLAGGIAHDFNNILSIIFGCTELSVAQAHGNKILTTYLEKLMTAAVRGRALIQNILTFSRQSDFERRPLLIQHIIKEALNLIRSTLPASIKISQKIDMSCKRVLADPTQIHQILMNLCTNAYHAMREKGGILEVCLSELTVNPNDTISKIHLNPGQYVHLTVSDTGHGITNANMERIFEPYFTTKSKGEGTGLGLSVVHGIVKSMDGHITVYSKPEQGTTFHVYLPLYLSAHGKEVIKEDIFMSFDPAQGGNEHILIVDDEEDIVFTERDFLMSLGYRVTALVNSVEAYEIFQKNSVLFDLLITDMDMPNMSGAELSEKILLLRPDFPIILMTGFSEIVTAEKAKSIGIQEYIMKPASMNSLALTIRKCLKCA